MRSRDIPFNPRVPPRIQFKIPKIKSILGYQSLASPTVREDERGRLVFKVDNESGDPLSTVVASDKISEFLGESVIVIDRSLEAMFDVQESKEA